MGTDDEDLEENQKCITGYWKRGIQWQKASMSCGVENRTCKRLSSVESAVWFLVCLVKKQKKRDKRKEKLSNKREPGLDGLRNPQPIQVAKDTKIKSFTVRKVCSGEKAECKVVQHFVNILERSKVQSIE